MKKKLVKIIALVLSLIGIFWYSSNVSATTIFSENFDSYNLNDSLSGKNGFYTSSCYDTYISNDVFLSSPYSLILNRNSCFMRDLTDDYTGVEDVYIEQDVYLSGSGSSLLVVFDNYANYFYVLFHAYYGTTITSNFPGYESSVTIDNDKSCFTSDYCQNWFNLGLDFHLDKITNTLYQSVYINNVLVETFIFTDYTSNLYTLQVKGSFNDVPVYIDNFKISDTLPSKNGECGTANGGHFSTPPDVSTLCSAESYVFLPSYVETPAGWTWICGGYHGGTQAYCSADFDYDLDPTIDDVIDFDWDDFDYDFEEEDVSKNWLIDVFKFLFLPREETLEKFFTTFDDFKEKIPFGYIYLIRDQFKEVSLESTDEFALDLNLLGEEYEVFSVSSLKEQIGENTFNIFYNTMKALIWIIFALYLITKVQKLFNNE